MLTLFRPGSGWLHRTPAGAKILGLLGAALAFSLVPSTYLAAAAAGSVVVAVWLSARLGWHELVRQVHGLRWVIVITLVGQFLFLTTEVAVANTARVVVLILLASLLAVTTRVAELLATFERALRPVKRIGMDPTRIALTIAVAINTVPVLARLAADVREAQHARGARRSVQGFVIPFLVLSLKYADDLGDALTARGVR